MTRKAPHQAWTENVEGTVGEGFLDAEASRWTLHRGLVLFAFALTVLSGILFSGGDLRRLLRPEVVPFVVTVFLVAPLILRERPWTYLLAGIGVTFTPITVFIETGIGELLEPAATVGFVSNLLLFGTLIVGFPSGLYGYLETRKGMRLVLFHRAMNTRHGVIAVVTGSILLGAAATSYIAGGHAPGAIAGEGAGYDIIPKTTLAMASDESVFQPSELTVLAGEPTKIVLSNHDAILHTFDYRVEERRFSHEMFPGQDTPFVVLLDEVADVGFVCKFHRDMKGVMHVVAAPEAT